MTHQSLRDLPLQQIRHQLRPLVEQEAKRLSRNDLEFRRLHEAGLNRLYSLEFPPHVTNIPGWAVGAIRKRLFTVLSQCPESTNDRTNNDRTNCHLS